MKLGISIRRNECPQSGMTLVELLISLLVLVIGLLSLVSLLVLAVSGNYRNKTDTGGTLVSQVFLEGILSQNNGGTVTVSDCANTNFTVATASPAGVGTSNGANLKADGTIDFSQDVSGVPANYKAQFAHCGTGGTSVVYDVRWNVKRINANSSLVTVSAQHRGVGSATLFTPPVSLRSIVTNN